MKVLEFGIILNGISVLYSQYASKDSQNQKVLQGDADLRNSMLGAIISSSRSVLTQHIQSLNFKKYKLVITSPSFPEELVDARNAPELIFYSIAEKKINVDYLTNLMEQIQDRFLAQYPDVLRTSTIETDKFTPFIPIVDNILKDLKDTASERFGHIF